MSKRTDMVVHERDPFNAEAPRAALLDAVTPNDSFYVRNHGKVPTYHEASWRLTVAGLVDTPLTLSLAELRDRFAEHRLHATLQCAGNRRVGLLPVRDIPGEAPWGPGATSTAEWTGVRLADVLAAAGLRPAARFVEFTAPDLAVDAKPPQPFGGSIELAKARSDEVLLAYAMNGVPLPAEHGAPLRAVVPGYIGARSVKWLDRITVRAEPSENYFQAVAYRLLPADASPARAAGFALSSVALNAEILRPADGDRVPAGLVRLAGYAYAGDARSVARVDVSADGCRWLQAAVEPPLSPWTWQHWSVDLDLSAGRHSIVARAWDSTGACQPESPAHVWNPKGYVNNSWPRIEVFVE